MAKRKVSGPVNASKGGNRKTNTKPRVKKKEPAKQKIKTRSKVKEGPKSSVQDEELAPAEVIQNGRRRGRSAKLQAVKKMATMQEDIKMAEGSNGDDDEDNVSLDLEYDDEDDVSLDLEYDDEEDEDDFETTLPIEKRTSNTRQQPLSSGKLKSQGKSKQLKEDLTALVKQVETKYEERYVCQASQEQFLSLSESDSSSEEEDIGDSSKVKHSSLKPIPDQSVSVNAAADKSKLMETRKELTGSSPVMPSHSALKSMFDDLEDMPDLEGSQPRKDGRCTQSLFDDVDQESDHGDLRTHEEETDATPVVTSQYFANSDGDECRSPDRKNLTLKEKLNVNGVNDARSTVKSTLFKSTFSDEIEKKEEDESEFEESPPKKAKKQIRKRPTTDKQAAKIEEKKTEKQTQKDDDPNILPATSQYFANSDADECRSPDRKNLTLKEKLNVNEARSTVKSTLFDEIEKKRDDESEFEESPPKKAKKQIRKRPTTGKHVAKIEEKKTEKQTKKDDDPKALPATSKKRGTKSQSTTSNKSVVKPERRRGGGTGDQPDVEDGIKHLAKKRKLSTGVKNFPASTVKKAGRGDQPDVKDRIDSPAKKRKLSNRMNNSSADVVKKAGRGTTKGKKETKMEVKKMEIKVKEEDMSSDDSNSDWEEVEDTPMNELGEPMLTPSPKKEAKAETMSLEIDIDLPGTSKAGKKKKKEYNWANYFQWQVNKYNKERQLELHKAHLVLLLASSFHSNKICNKMELQCVALSTIPGEILSKRPKQLNINYLSKVLGWFKNCFKIRSDLKEDLMTSLDWILPSMFEKRQAASERQLVHMFAIILRCLGVDVRLIFSLQPLTFKAKKLTKKFKKQNEKATVKKPLSQSSMQEQEKVPLKQSSSSGDISSPSKSGQSTSKLSSNKSSASAPKKHSTSASIKTTLSKSRQQPTKPSSSKLSASASKTQSTSSNMKMSSSKAAHSPSKSLSNSSSSSATAKTQSTSSDTKTSPLKSGQRRSKASSSKSSTSAPKTQTTSSNPRTTSSKTVQGKGKAHSGQAIKEQKTAPKTRSTFSDTKMIPLKSGQRRSTVSSSKSSASAPKTQATSSNPKTTSSKAVQGKGKAPTGQAIKEQMTAPQKKPGSKMRFEMSRSTGKEGGEKWRIPFSERHTPKRTLRVKNNTRRTMASKMNPKYNENNDEEDESGDDDHSDYEEELRKSASKRKSRAPPTKGSSRKKAKMASSVSSIEEVSSDNDFEVQVMSVTKQPRKTETKKGGIKKKASRKVLSSDSDESVMLVDILDPGSDCWLEVYLSSEKRWVCVDCVRMLINKPEMCEKKATQPITYVIGVENDGCVKDVTRRYACKWMTETHKLRPVEEWWEETLKPYQSYKDRDMKEDSDVQSNLTSKPFPTSIAEYKNHPLYALKRHLLKFEALYPESAAILGYCKGEPVYSRECVHSLHTRETWMKEGKAIRIGEKPYKMVKPRPKWKKGQGMIKTEEAILGIFGAWQVEDYIPPPAVDGKVPRNEYGNVELFKPTMLPAGTLHLKIPGLNKIARKLDIDCAPAMMGWDFHSGYIHPVMDGFVVCEEHVDVLVAAWEEDKAEQEKKEKEKREARALNHWKLLIKSLLIRERLKKRYGKNDPNFDAPGTSQQSETDRREDCSPVKASWPENKMTAFTGDEGNLLPFEKKSKKKKKR